MNEYNWSEATSDEDLASSRIATEERPSRVTLSYLLVDSRPDPDQLRLAVIHPESFDSWMFPYGGLRLDEPVDTAESLADIGMATLALLARHANTIAPAVESELSQYFTDLTYADLPEPSFRSFSLKYSQNSHQWTAYVFLYHRTDRFTWREGVRETAWIDLDGAAIEEILATEKFRGRRVEGNVVVYLRSLVSPPA